MIRKRTMIGLAVWLGFCCLLTSGCLTTFCGQPARYSRHLAERSDPCDFITGVWEVDPLEKGSKLRIEYTASSGMYRALFADDDRSNMQFLVAHIGDEWYLSVQRARRDNPTSDVNPHSFFLLERNSAAGTVSLRQIVLDIPEIKPDSVRDGILCLSADEIRERIEGKHYLISSAVVTAYPVGKRPDGNPDQ